MSTEQASGGTAAQGGGRTRRTPPSDALRALGPVEREAVAQWVEGYITGHEAETQQLLKLQAEGQEFPGLANRLAYNRVLISVCKQLAWVARTGRGGPQGGQRRRKKT